MIREYEITQSLESLVYIFKRRIAPDMVFLEKVEKLVKRIKDGEPIQRGTDPIHETHGNGD